MDIAGGSVGDSNNPVPIIHVEYLDSIPGSRFWHDSDPVVMN